MKRLKITLMAIVLIPALFLQGCFFLPGPAPAVQPPDISDTPDAEPDGTSARVTPVREGRFTLRYDSGSTLNPITGTNRDNLLIAELMYERLFELNGSLEPEPVLCESYFTEDNITYVLNLKPGIAMSDGSTMTAGDVAYSLRLAAERARFSSRLRNIESVASDGDLAVTVTLRSPNSRFIRLLDVPIIKNGSIDNRIPPGSGAYVYMGDDARRLDRLFGYRDFDSLPVSSVYLRECGDNEVTEMFSQGELSLVWTDPAGAAETRLNRIHETRYYDTTTLQFLGFNTRTESMKNSDVRRVIGSAINRGYIAETIMPGQALAAPLALSPVLGLYDINWESGAIYPLREISELLNRAGIEDADDDSFLDYPVGSGYERITIDFIVNTENEHKAQAAHNIAEALGLIGLNVTVRELSWESFLEALDTGDFDMYYGEAALNADFDLSPLLLPDGGLVYGGTGSEQFREFIDAFLSAQTDDERRAAAKLLCDQITREAPFIPVLYKRYAVHTAVGAVSGLSPSQSSIFHAITGWTIHLEAL